MQNLNSWITNCYMFKESVGLIFIVDIFFKGANTPPHAFETLHFSANLDVYRKDTFFCNVCDIHDK